MVENATVVRIPCVFISSTSCLAVVSWSPPSNSQSANVTHYIIDVSVAGEGVFINTNINTTSNEAALSAYYVVPNCTEEYLRKFNVTVSGFAVNECGEGQRLDALLLLDPADSIDDSKVSCPANSIEPGTVTTASNASPATECELKFFCCIFIHSNVYFSCSVRWVIVWSDRFGFHED